ncbi:MAG: hypothetical protein II333_12210 [Clostridia bacterium]|nr:hypothetical protein [Clostridia bacterium]
MPAENNAFVLKVPEGERASYLVVREDIREGQRIRGFRILADGKEIYDSQCVGHKRIVPLGDNGYREITFCVTEAAENWALRDIALY